MLTNCADDASVAHDVRRAKDIQQRQVLQARVCKLRGIMRKVHVSHGGVGGIEPFTSLSTRNQLGCVVFPRGSKQPGDCPRADRGGLGISGPFTLGSHLTCIFSLRAPAVDI